MFLALHTTPLSFQIISSLFEMFPASKTLSRDIQSLTQFLYLCLPRSLDMLNVIFLSVSSSMMFPLSYWKLLFCKLLLCAFGKKLPSFFLCICLFFSFWKFDRASTPFCILLPEVSHHFPHTSLPYCFLSSPVPFRISFHSECLNLPETSSVFFHCNKYCIFNYDTSFCENKWLHIPEM